MSSFYNDTDAYCGQWMRNLIAAGHITPGVVDERSICEIQPTDLMGHERVHLFAGIAGWDYALRLAGWPAGVPVWTGSCPCQPFSCAGKGLGAADKRHLWPEMFRLIRECRPPVVFGEQVAPKAGREWLSGVFADLESVGYAVAGADLCAAGVGAPHIRQRLYWVAISGVNVGQLFAWKRDGSGQEDVARTPSELDRCGDPGGVADASDNGHPSAYGLRAAAEPSGQAGTERVGEFTGSGDTFWAASRWYPCRDGKYRRVPLEPALFPLANGLPGRVGQLRAAGNSIVPQLAAAFIETVMEAIQ